MHKSNRDDDQDGNRNACGVIAISKQSVRTEAQLGQVLQVLDKLESKQGSVLLTNGIQGRNFKVANNYAVPIGQDDSKVKVVQNDVDNAFIQLGTRASVGMGAYQLLPNDDPSRRFLMEDNPQLSRARLELAMGIAQIIRSGLDLMGVTATEEMR